MKTVSLFDDLLIQISAILTKAISAENIVSPMKIVNTITNTDNLTERLQFIVMLNTVYLLKTSGIDIKSNLKDVDANLELLEDVINDLERLRNAFKESRLEHAKS